MTFVLIPAKLAAEDRVERDPRELHHYAVIALGTLGGGFSSGNGLNERGSVAGVSLLPGDATEHAFIWRSGMMTDLGTLGGPNSDSSEGPGINSRGEVVGFSDTLILDPNAENFCGNFGDFPNPYTCLPFVWRDGVMTALPTLGGYNGGAIAINNRRQVAGVAETDVPDPNCAPGPLVLHFEPVIWERGTIEQLPTVAGDSDGFVNGINDKGQLVGFTGPCFPVHAVLWEKGKARDLGNLGGAFNNIAFEINNQGQVVGQSDLSGDLTHHAFLWERGAMRDLGTLPGLPVSLAQSINSRGQIVGYSQPLNGSPVSNVAWIWQHGVMTELNTLIPSDSHLLLLEALGINGRGEISGYAINTETGLAPAFLAIPCDDDHPDVEGCDYSMVEAAEVSSDTSAMRAPQSTQLSKEAIARMMGASRNPFLWRYRLPGLRPSSSN